MQKCYLHIGTCKVFTDSLSVITNVTQTALTLKKKHFGITFHYVREAVTVGIIDVYHIRSEDNPANPLTKSVSSMEMNIIKEMFFHRRKNAEQ